VATKVMRMMKAKFVEPFSDMLFLPLF